ncbi:hypothetical protein EVAR_12943_1 [Eumeta japonica]|uniref:Uncharacterized protein n=1 Tax=Eumeta variegata TaxID=151549 RepID=A0A4C1TVY5_EUMVA|nr:hypothetical protein EVAR_12943_1 [Eumeta japonica]
MVNVPAFTTYCGLGAERIGPITAISRSCANPFASDPRSFVGAAISVILHIITTIKRPKTVNVPDFNQPKNQAQADSNGVSTDVEECTSGTKKLLMELGIKPRCAISGFYDSTSEYSSSDNFPDVHVSADEDMPSSSRTFRVSSPTEALLILKVEVVMMIQNFRMTMMPNILSLPPKKIQQNLSNDEELPPQVAASARFMEAEMDVDHEKLLSGDVNFKWQRDFTAFTAVREEFCPPSWCDNDKQPLPNAKASNRLLPVTNQLLTRWHDTKCRGFDCLGTERLTRKNIPEDVKEMKKNCEKGTIIACHSGDVMVLAGCKNLIDD